MMAASFRDESRLDAVEKVVALAEETGIKITHLAMAFAIAHPGVTSAIVGGRPEFGLSVSAGKCP